MAVEVGQHAPDFTLKNQAGEDVTLSSFRGARNVVVVFYPAAFSGACTTHFTDIGANERGYADMQAQVLGVSVDGFHAQAAFARSLGLDATMMLADFEPKGAVARSYGVYLDERGQSARATFVIDKQGVIQHVDIPVPREIPDEGAIVSTLNTCSA